MVDYEVNIMYYNKVILNKGGEKQLTKIKVALFMAVTTLLTFVALVGSAGACLALHYQPETPNSLQRFE